MRANRLQPGDTIGIAAPSNPVTPDNPQFLNGVACLERMGFQVKLASNVFSHSQGYAASPQEKAADLNQLFGDPRVQAILCAQGGDNCNAVLPYLDWELIARSPKIFSGISDITVLLNAINTRTGLVTFHGNDVMWGLGRTPTAYDLDEFKACLVQGRTGAIPPARPRKTVRPGVAEGRLLGGNLSCLRKLIGTPYWPDFTGAILFLECLGWDAPAIDCQLHHLRQLGVFEQVSGVLLGSISGLDDDPAAGPPFEEVLLNVLGETRLPVLKVFDFGHNCPNTVLPVGARVRMDTEKQEIVILEKVVN
jgi:muramoyltetrapeptide carboxypeptidase